MFFYLMFFYINVDMNKITNKKIQSSEENIGFIFNAESIVTIR